MQWGKLTKLNYNLGIPPLPQGHRKATFPLPSELSVKSELNLCHMGRW